jgi:hypothetical protein
MKRFVLSKIIKIVILAPLFIFGIGYITMELWNCLVPELFHGPLIDFWQAIGLLILSKILFGGFKGRGGCCCGHGHGSWKERMKNKWDNLSEDERKSLKNRFFSKCSYKEEKIDFGSETQNK